MTEFEINGKLKTNDRIRIVNKNDKSDIRILTVKAGGITGFTKKKILGDEFFKWKEDIANTQLLPQFQVEQACALLFTTLRFVIAKLLNIFRQRSHWSTRWLTDGEDLVNFTSFGEICINCIKLPYEDAIKCSHVR